MKLGADPEQLDGLADHLKKVAKDIDAATSAVSRDLTRSWWVGPNADEFRRRWTGVHRPAANAVAEALKAMGDTVQKNANEQRKASEADGGSGSSGGQTPKGDHHGGLDQWDDILKKLGYGKDAADLIKEALGAFKPELLEDILKFLKNNPALLDALKAFDAVLGGAGVLLDFVKDFASHGNLPLDEQILHATLTAGIKYAESAGIEALAKYAGAALVGGATGGTLAVVGALAGQGIGMALSYGFEKLDGALDLNEHAVDILVSGYHEAKDLGGLIVNAADDAVDAVVDKAGDLWDAGTDALSDLGDAATFWN